jgi:transposase
MTRPLGRADELERRRRHAVELLAQGESPSLIARILGVHETSVHRWRRLEALQGLQARPNSGRTPRLTEAQMQSLVPLLQQGAVAHGWPNALWTCSRVAVLIERQFGVRYHRDHVRKILQHRLNWSHQKPETRAREQDAKEVERWKDDEFPRIMREAWIRSATLVFLDESGFQLTPLLRHTWSPRGKTPIVDVWQRHDRISVISGVSLNVRTGEPGLCFEMLPTDLNARAEDIVCFLRDLRKEHPEPLTIVWDRHRIHSKAVLVKEWLAGEPGVVLESLPAYAPKLNPDEMVWAWLKYGRLGNLAPQQTQELRDHLTGELQWGQFDKDLLRGFINHAKLGVDLELTSYD